MTAKEKELFDQKGKIWDKMNDVARSLKEGKTLNDDEQRQFEAWDKEYNAIAKNLEILKRSAELEASNTAARGEERPGNGEEPEKNERALESRERRKIFLLGENRGVATLTKEEQRVYQEMQKENRAFTKYFYGGALDESETKIVADLQKRAQSTAVAAGGYSIPQGFIAKIESKLKYISPFFEEMQYGVSSEADSIFDVVRTETGNDLPFPTDDDTATTGELLAENADAYAATADLTLGQITLKAYKYSSKPMKASNEILNDTGVDLEGRLISALATRIGRIGNTHFTTGDNTAKPQGIVTGATAGKTTASGTAITFPEVLDLVHSIDPAYRKSPSVRFMMHDNVLLYLKKLTIGSSTNDSRPLWQPGYATGAPDTIDGYRYLINQDMASSVAVNNITMLFGDMKKYMIRVVSNYAVRRLNERFADFDQTAWLLFARLDGRYANTAAIKKLTQAAV